MPIFKHLSSFHLAKNLRAFLRLEAGVTRGGIPGSHTGKTQESEGPRGQLARRDARTSFPGRNIKPENIVWIFSSGRSGTTWLRDMMSEMPGHWAWEEPRVGTLFGGFHNSAGPNQLKSKNHIMGESYRSVWVNSIRNFVLDGAGARFPEMGEDDYLIIKEPNGSEGAPLLMEALPESRMILLLRDPRDVCASVLDGAKQGHWQFERNEGARWKTEQEADRNPDEFIKRPARNYIKHLGGAVAAYDAHEGPRALVRYEDLNADALEGMGDIYSSLGMNVSRKDLSKVVEKHSWDNIPAKKKGEGKFYRKAATGGWEEDLTPRQVEIVEGITEPLLDRFYGKQGA